jgi:subtilisin family serine protease
MNKSLLLVVFLIVSSLQALYAGELPQRLLMDRPTGAARLDIPRFDRIDETLLREGSVRVIIRVTPPPELVDGFVPEMKISKPGGIDRQRQAIRGKQERLLSRVSQRHGAAARRFEFIPYLALEVDPEEFLALAASPDLDYIQEDSVVYPTLAQSVPLIGGVGGSFGGYTGLGQTVAILDTGVDKKHPFLTGKVLDEACYSTVYPTYSITSLCPNGQTTMIGSGSGVNCSGSLPGCYHGTHVAGIVAGLNASISGVAKDAGIIAIQVFSRSDSATYCGGTAPCIMAFDSDLIDGLGRVYALRNSYRIASVNMSLGGGLFSGYCDSEDAAVKDAIDTLRSVGIATVIAAGNDGSSTKISYPGCISSAISVGATTKADLVAGYSNSSSILNLLAPGSSIYSSLPGTGYGYLSGTSMATPHVAGAWAVLKSAKPTATVTELLNVLTTTGVPIADSRNLLVKPRIRLDAAVMALVAPTPPTVVSRDPAAGATGVPVTGGIKVTFSTAMKADTITPSTFFMNNGVTGTVSYDAVTFTATFTPSSALSPATFYMATITTGVTDAAGTPLAVAENWSFTTQVPKLLTVTSVNPGSGLAVTVAPLDLSGNGGGSTPFSRSYLPESTATLTAPATSGGNFFSSWSGCDSYSGRSCAVTLLSDRTVMATYVTPTVEISIQGSPGGVTFSADGVLYDTPHTFVWEVGSSHSLATNSPQSGSSGIRYPFISWSDGGAVSHDIVVPGVASTYTVMFATEYQLTTAVSPLVAGSVSPLSGFYYPAGGVVDLSALAASGYFFSGWSGPVASVTSAVTTITMSGPQSVTAQFSPKVARSNVALASNGGLATASSQYGVNYPVAAVINGDRKGLVWGSGGGWNDATNSTYPDWVEIAFNGAKTIDEIDLFTLQDIFSAPVEPTTTQTFTKYGITNFDIQYWDGSAWVTVPGGSITGNNLVWRTVTFPAVTTSRIRVVVNGSLGGYSRITEVEAYSTTGGSVNAPPVVTLTSPLTGAISTAPTSIVMTATASDSDGTVSRVDFYNGSTFLGSAAAVPYSFTWNGVAAGSYTLSARAYDNLGAWTDSIAVTVTVTGAVARSNVALAANGGLATASSQYSVNYPVAAVINGDRKGLVWGSGGGWNDATNSTYPDWVEIAFNGAKTIDEIDLFTLQDTYNAPLEPTATQTFSKYGVTAFDIQYWDGAVWVTLPGGSITGNNLVWRTVTFPAVTTSRIRVLVNGSLGGYSRITEIEAYSATGGAVNVPPVVTLTSPLAGAISTAPASIVMTATASDSDGTVSRVDFYNGSTFLGSAAAAPYSVTWIGVPAGSYTLSARAYDNLGAWSDSTAVTVTVTGAVARSNVALAANGGLATASSQYSVNYPVAAVINGDRKGVAWGNGGGWNDATNTAYPDWVEIAFNGAKTIDEIDLFTLQDTYNAPLEPTTTQTFTRYGITAFDIQYWDGSAWVTLPGGSSTGNNLVWRTVTFPAVTTTRIRIVVNGSLGGYSRITEIEAYGI